jgi:hypothetical protein
MRGLAGFPAKREIKADEAGHLAAMRWARGLDEKRAWAIEDRRRDRGGSTRR